MLSSKYILAVIAMVSCVSAAAINDRSAQASVTVSFCTGTYTPQVGCRSVPVLLDTCTDFKNALEAFDEQLAGAYVPKNYACTFFSYPSCGSFSGTSDSFYLAGASTGLGANFAQKYVDEFESVSCSKTPF